MYNRNDLTCLSSYPELRIMGGNRRLKKSVCLNVCKTKSVSWHAVRNPIMMLAQK